jgi:DNA-binding transcriptional LysR family regulator
MLNAALSRLGLGFMLEDVVHEHLVKGELIPVLEDWSPTFTGFHLYYPSRRQASPAFALLVDALRYRPLSNS